MIIHLLSSIIFYISPSYLRKDVSLTASTMFNLNKPIKQKTGIQGDINVHKVFFKLSFVRYKAIWWQEKKPHPADLQPAGYKTCSSYMNPPGLFPYDKTVLRLVLRRSFFRKLLHLRIEETSAGKKKKKKKLYHQFGDVRAVCCTSIEPRPPMVDNSVYRLPNRKRISYKTGHKNQPYSEHVK